MNDPTSPDAVALTRRIKRARKARLERVLPLVLDFCELLERADGARPFYIQVGAHDGVQADPMHARARSGAWSGLLIEPSAIYFARLQALYADRPDMAVVNLGVSDRAGEMELHFLDEAHAAEYPPAMEGCASLDRELLIGHLSQHSTRAAQHVRSETVPLKPLDDVLRDAGVTRATGLIVDVEGHEAQVFRGFSLEDLAPRFVFFEHKHLEKEARDTILARFDAAGYSIHRIRQDTLCLRADMDFAGLMGALDALDAGPRRAP